MINVPKSGKSLPKPKIIKTIGENIVKGVLPRCFEFTLKKTKNDVQRNIFYVAKHQDVIDIMTGQYRDQVTLSHFDEALATGVGEERFFLGAKSAQHIKQWDILKAALALPPQIARGNSERIEDITHNAATKVISRLKNKARFFGQNFKFNAVKEYGFVVPYLVAEEFIGIEMPKRSTFWLSLMTLIRNLVKPGWVSLKGDNKSAMQMLLWSHMVFGHLFANFGNRNRGLARVSQYFSKAFFRQIDYSFDNAENIAPGSLLHRLRLVRPEFDISDKEYQTFVRGIVLEFSGAMQVLTGTSFANIIQTMIEQNLSFGDLNDLLEKDGFNIIDEALRLNATTKCIYRVATDYFEIDGVQISPKDTLCLIIEAANRDASAFPHPNVFSNFTSTAPNRNSENYLSFGPNEILPSLPSTTTNTHSCFGQYWAKSILMTMLKRLEDLDDVSVDLTKKRGVTEFLGLPDAIQVKFKKPQELVQQSLVTICSEISIPLEDIPQGGTNVQELLENMNNPAKGELQTALQSIETLHFISMHVVKGKEGTAEPDYIFLEMSVDGTEEDGIDALCKGIGSYLIPIYQAGGCIKNARELRGHLFKNSRTVKPTIWPKFFEGKRVTGIGFSGTEGLSVKRIKAEQALASHASNILNGHLDEDGSNEESATLNKTLPAHKLLKRVKRSILTSNREDLDNSRWVLNESVAPSFAETRESKWQENWTRIHEVTRLFPRSFMLFLGFFFLVFWAVMWEILFEKFGAGFDKDLLCNAQNQCISETFTSAPFGWVTYSSVNQTHYLYLSAMPVLLNIALALLFTWCIGKLTGMLSRRIPWAEAKRAGEIFWFLPIFLFLQFHDYIFSMLDTVGLSLVSEKSRSILDYLNFYSGENKANFQLVSDYSDAIHFVEGRADEQSTLEH